MSHLIIYMSNDGTDAPLTAFTIDGKSYAVDARTVGNSHGQAHRLCRGGDSMRETESGPGWAKLVFASPSPHIEDRVVSARKLQTTMMEGVLVVATSRKYWVEYIAIGYDDKGGHWTYSSDPRAPFPQDATFTLADDCRSVTFRSSQSRARYTRRAITYYDLSTGMRYSDWKWLKAVR